MNNQQMRDVFERWYTDQALATGDTTPLGSRSCALQWAAWQAATLIERERAAKVCDEWSSVRRPLYGGIALGKVAVEIRKGETP